MTEIKSGHFLLAKVESRLLQHPRPAS